MRLNAIVTLTVVTLLGWACSSKDTPAPPSEEKCPSTQVICGEVCVDLARDDEHCGACGETCGEGESCEEGGCVRICPGGQALCGDSCRDVSSDPMHCGDCDAPCDAGQLCSNGACGLTCAAGQVACGGQCVDPQTSNAYCGASGDCQGANAGESCAAGYVCSNGACGLTCAAGQVECGGQCVDPQTSNAYCGASSDCQGANAGESCAAGYVCSNGACGLTCAAGQVACGGQCVDPQTSNAYCGASGDCLAANAGQVCSAGELCMGGSCALSCPTNQIACGGQCVDPQTSNAYCGASGDCLGANAGQVCSVGELCMGGSCALSCPTNQIACGGQCVSPQTDNGFCGASGDCQGANAGQACGAGQVCNAGTCAVTCTPGMTDCGGGCFDLSSSPMHCGGCGTACAGGEACFGGNCVFVGCDWNAAAFNSSLGILPDPAGQLAFGPSCELYVGSPYSTSVYRYDFDSSTPSLFYQTFTSDRVHALVFHPGKGHLFVAFADSPSATVWAVAPAGGAATNLNVSGLPVVPTGARLAPAGWGAHGGKLVMGFTDGTIWVIDLDTSNATLLATLPGDVGGLAFDGSTLYTTNFDSPVLLTVSPTGVVTPFVNMPCQIGGIEVEPGARLFVNCGFDSDVYEVSLPGGVVSLLFSPTGGTGSFWRAMKWDGVDSLLYAEEPFHLKGIDL